VAGLGGVFLGSMGGSFSEVFSYLKGVVTPVVAGEYFVVCKRVIRDMALFVPSRVILSEARSIHGSDASRPCKCEVEHNQLPTSS
jgi:hypothetical protein